LKVQKATILRNVLTKKKRDQICVRKELPSDEFPSILQKALLEVW